MIINIPSSLLSSPLIHHNHHRSILSAEEVAQLEALHLAVDSPSSGQGQTDRGAKGQGRKSLAAQQVAKELKYEKEKGIEVGKVEEGEGGEGGEEDENNEVEEEAEGEGSDGDIMSIEDEAEMSERDKKEEEGEGEVEEGSESLDVKEMDMEGEAEVGAGVAETRVDAATEQQSVQEGTQDNTGENTQKISLDNSSANRDSQETESIVWSSLEEARAVEEVVPFVPPTEPVKDPTTVGESADRHLTDTSYLLHFHYFHALHINYSPKDSRPFFLNAYVR